MNKKRWLWAGLALAGIGLLLLPLMKRHGADAHKNHMEAAKDLYYCPMHPSYTSDHPGDCPICGMSLVKKETEKGMPMKAAGPVYISPEQQQLVGIKTATVERRPLVRELQLSGTVAYDPDLFVAQQEYLRALRLSEQDSGGEGGTAELNASMLKAVTSKLTLMGMGTDEIAALRQKGEADANLFLAQAGEPLWVYLSAFEGDVGAIQEGQSVAVETTALPGTILPGTVRGITPVIDAMSRAARVRVSVPNPDNQLKPGMLVRAVLSRDQGEKLAVPADAVMETGERQIVFVADDKDHFAARDVTVGPQAGGWREVLSGLQEGEKVVSGGNFFVDSEARLKSAISGSGGHQH